MISLSFILIVTLNTYKTVDCHLEIAKASQREQTCMVTAVSVVKIYLQLIIIDKFTTFELNKLKTRSDIDYSNIKM